MIRSDPLLEIDDLRVAYPDRRGRPVIAVDGVTLTVHRGETLGLVGESGSGKSTIGNVVLGLVKPRGGRVRFDGHDITNLAPRERRRMTRRIQVVFQDPFGSLNPARTIGQTVGDPLRAQRALSPTEIDSRVGELLGSVGLAAEAAQRYPSHFSGGQRQRIAIARALIAGPDLIICDEPTSSLDLSVQAQVLNLLMDLQEKLKLSYLFISHDLGVVRHVSHRIAVLQQGAVVEEGPADEVANRPSRPYTQALIASTPAANPEEQAARRRQRIIAASRNSALTWRS